MPSLRFARAESSIGPILVAESGLGIAAIDRSDALESFLAPLRRRFAGFDLTPAALDGGWLTEALRGGPLPPVDLRGLSSFDGAVYEAVRSIPAGETLTYGEVARLISSAGASRAVGGALARCPLFPAVPCHRVVRAADGWSGWGADIALKRRLLAAERASPVSQPGPR